MVETRFICDVCERTILNIDQPYSLRETQGGTLEIKRGIERGSNHVCGVECLQVMVPRMVSKL